MAVIAVRSDWRPAHPSRDAAPGTAARRPMCLPHPRSRTAPADRPCRGEPPAPAARDQGWPAVRAPAAHRWPAPDPPARALEVFDRGAHTSTRESGSSIQSTGTSWIRSPRRSARTSSSVSKNQPSSLDRGSSRCATSARTALNPHCASVKRPQRACGGSSCSCARSNSRLGPRTTREPRAAASRSRRRCGPRAAARPAAAARARSVERSTSM